MRKRSAKRKASSQKDGSGPTLPYKLARELGTTAGTADKRKARRGQSMFLVSQRKEARKAARKAKKQKGAATKNRLAARDSKTQVTDKGGPTDERSAKKRRMAPIELARPAASTRDTGMHKSNNATPEKPMKTKFSLLLSADILKGTDQRAIDAEAAQQRQLAKKLGIKGKSAKVAEPSSSAKDLLVKDLRMPETDDEAEAEMSNDDSASKGSQSSDLFNESSDIGGTEGLSEDASEAATGSGAEESLSEGISKEEQGSDEDGFSEDNVNQPAFVSRPPVAAQQEKYIPPAARKSLAGEEQHDAQLRRRVTGLVNRLSDPNLAQVTLEVLGILGEERRRAVSDMLAELLLQAAAEGPRATDRFAAVTAAFVSSLAGRADAADIGANFAASLAERLEAACVAADSPACSNLGNVFAQLYVCNLLPASCLYSLLEHLRRRFQEQDVVLMHLLLKSCGIKLRSDDPIAMKEFVVAVHSRAAEAKGTMTQRTEVMLELVLDVKNNRRPKGSAAASQESLLSQGSLKFLRDSKGAEVQLRTVTWEKLLQPSKKGMWWLPSAAELETLGPLQRIALPSEDEWSTELLRLAAKQRMNTDVRRAVFCIVMGSEDFVDASERLLRLPLKGESRREIVRVAVECCLQEAAWNPYYGVLLKNILDASKSHAMTAQFCIWDHLKEVGRQEERRARNFACLVAQLISSQALPFTVLRTAQMGLLATKQEEMLWRTFFERLLLAPKDNAGLQALLKPLVQPQTQKFASTICGYLKETFDPSVQRAKEAARLLARSRAAQIYLATS